MFLQHQIGSLKSESTVSSPVQGGIPNRSVGSGSMRTPKGRLSTNNYFKRSGTRRERPTSVAPSVDTGALKDVGTGADHGTGADDCPEDADTGPVMKSEGFAAYR